MISMQRSDILIIHEQITFPGGGMLSQARPHPSCLIASVSLTQAVQYRLSYVAFAVTTEANEATRAVHRTSRKATMDRQWGAAAVMGTGRSELDFTVTELSQV